jgi:hypothetical protein
MFPVSLAGTRFGISTQQAAHVIPFLLFAVAAHRIDKSNAFISPAFLFPESVLPNL